MDGDLDGLLANRSPGDSLPSPTYQSIMTGVIVEPLFPQAEHLSTRSTASTVRLLRSLYSSPISRTAFQSDTLPQAQATRTAQPCRTKSLIASSLIRPISVGEQLKNDSACAVSW